MLSAWTIQGESSVELDLGQCLLTDAFGRSRRSKLAGKVQWLRSHIAADKTFCIYLAESEALVREHSRIAGFPVTRVTEVPIEIGPMTAYSD